MHNFSIVELTCLLRPLRWRIGRRTTCAVVPGFVEEVFSPLVTWDHSTASALEYVCKTGVVAWYVSDGTWVAGFDVYVGAAFLAVEKRAYMMTTLQLIS